MLSVVNLLMNTRKDRMAANIIVLSQTRRVGKMVGNPQARMPEEVKMAEAGKAFSPLKVNTAIVLLKIQHASRRTEVRSSLFRTWGDILPALSKMRLSETG